MSPWMKMSHFLEKEDGEDQTTPTMIARSRSKLRFLCHFLLLCFLGVSSRLGGSFFYDDGGLGVTKSRSSSSSAKSSGDDTSTLLDSVEKMKDTRTFTQQNQQQQQQQQQQLQFVNCTGKAWERRELARRGNGTAEEWRALAQCFQKRLEELSSHFVIHISKAGGTSLCNLFKQEGCYDGLRHNTNCNLHNVSSLSSNTAPYSSFLGWVRPTALEDEGFELRPFTMMLTEQQHPHISDPNCAQLAQYFTSHNISMLMLERFLPPTTATKSWIANDGLSCSDQFMSTIVFREPMDRLLSHYNYLAKTCYKGLCNRMLLQPSQLGSTSSSLEEGYENTTFFNVSRMVQDFDLISDNHYLRILNGKKGFLLPLGELRLREDLLQHAISVLNDIDWILIMGRRNQTSADTEESLFIIQNGIGFDTVKSMPHANGAESEDLSQDRRQWHRSKIKHPPRQRSRHHANSSFQIQGQFTPQDKDWLRTLNRLDYMLWEEAQRLHDLDVLSLHMLQRHAADIMNKMGQQQHQQQPQNCCGRVCT